MLLVLASPVSAAILLLIGVVSVIGLFYRPALIERNLLRPYHLFRSGEYGTLITSGFIHADLPHLLFNGFTFYAFGFALERTIGSLSMFNLYAIGLLVSGLGSWAMHREEPGYRTLGASGAILAVLFASIIYNPRSSMMIFPLPIPIPAPLFAFGYLAYSFIAARRGGGRVNHDAHLSGAAAGVLFVWITDPHAVSRLLSAWLPS